MVKKEIELLDYQKGHVHELRQVLKHSWFAFDFSLLGLGKTYTSAKISEDYDHVIVIAPLSVAQKWIQLKKDYHLENVKYIGTYQSMRGENFPYLKFDKENGKFTPTEKLIHLAQTQKLLVVIDEVQNIKNKSLQNQAAKALVGPICNLSPKRSKFLGLSASPLDKDSHVQQLYNFLGFNEKEMCNGNTEYPLVSQTIREINIAKDANFFAKIFGNFQGDFKKRFVRRMPIQERNVHLNIFNAYYPIVGPDNAVALGQAMNRFNDLLLGRPGENPNPKKLAMLSVIMHSIESAKIDTIVKAVKDRFKEKESEKIVVMVNYTDSVRKLEQDLEMFKPLTLTGSVTGPKRHEILKKFQEHNSTHKLLVGNLKVLSTGIDLDDTDGKFPRFCIVSPNYNYLDLYQLNHRFLRAFTKSDSEIHYFFIHGTPEKRLLANIARKKGILAKVADDQVMAKVKLPGDFPDLYVDDNVIYKFGRLFDVFK